MAEIGFTQIPNRILENLSMLPLNGTQYRILITVIRYTFGFHRNECEISETFISKAIGVHKKQVQRELNELIKFNIVVVKKEATFKTSRVISINGDMESYQVTKKLPPNRKDTHTGSKKAPSPGSGLAPQEINLLNKSLNKYKAGEENEQCKVNPRNNKPWEMRSERDKNFYVDEFPDP